MRSFYTLLLGLIFIAKVSYAQEIPIGDWRVHASYSRGEYVAKMESKVYCGSADGLFYYDTEDGSLNKVSKVDGLSDIRISALNHHKNQGYIEIAYESGNLDLLNDDEIININDIERKDILGSKKINFIYNYGDFAYLCTDFGVVVLNIPSREIKETYGNIGPGGSSIEVYSCTINSISDSIFLATENGVMVAYNHPAVNLLDFSNWSTFQSSDGISTAGVSDVVVFNDTVYASVEEDTVKWYNGSEWENTSISLTGLGTIYSMVVTNDGIVLNSDGAVLEITSTSEYQDISNPDLSNPRDVIVDEDGLRWFAAYGGGLVRNEGTDFTSLIPNGPSTNNTFKLYAHDNRVINIGGGFSLSGYAPSYSNSGFHIYEEGQWVNKNKWLPGYPDLQDVTSGIYDPIGEKYYFTSYGYGLMIWDENTDTYEVINDTTTGSTFVTYGGGNSMRALDVEQDEDGNIWVATHVQFLGEPSLHRITQNGTMTGFSFNQTNAKVPLEIVIDEYNNKWMRLGGTGGLRGIYVFNENDINNSGDDQGVYLDLGNNLPDADVKSIDIDKNGEIWCGTNQGVAVFYNPSQVFTTNIQASTPIFDFRPLLKEESVTALKVDAGNRKWIGTQNGVWLFNENGTKQIYHFNKDNSPLPSNNILDIEINETSGEVFFSTDEGLISWRGTATESEGFHQNVKVFPNPVLADFDGLVGISGLATNSVVKITDISGKLIYETDANGGTATWDLRGLNNQRAKSGIYLIYSSTADGEDAFVAKVAVIE